MSRTYVEETSDAVEVGSVAISVDLNLPFVLGGLELTECIGVDVPVTMDEVVLDELASKLVSGEAELVLVIVGFPADL